LYQVGDLGGHFDGTSLLGIERRDDRRCADNNDSAYRKIDYALEGCFICNRARGFSGETCGFAGRARKVLRKEHRPDHDGSF